MRYTSEIVLPPWEKITDSQIKEELKQHLGQEMAKDLNISYKTDIDPYTGYVTYRTVLYLNFDNK